MKLLTKAEAETLVQASQQCGEDSGDGEGHSSRRWWQAGRDYLAGKTVERYDELTSASRARPLPPERVPSTSTKACYDSRPTKRND